MDKLRRLLAPAFLGTCLSLTGCTGINPFNWASIDGPCCHGPGHCDSCESDEMPMFEGEYQGGPIMSRARGLGSQGLLARGILREHWNLARSFEESGDTEQAAAHYEKILSMQPDYAPAHHRLGVLATMWGRFGDADEHFRMARTGAQPQPATEETYVEENVKSEQEAEEQIRREIAAERGETHQAKNEQATAASPVRRRFQLGARLKDAYYAQQETSAPTSVVVPPTRTIQSRIASRLRPAGTIASSTPTQNSRTMSSGSSSSIQSEKAARTQSHPTVRKSYEESEEFVEETVDSEVRSTSTTTQSNSTSKATIRPTASSVTPASRPAPLSRSAEVRENVLRSNRNELPAELGSEMELAEESASAISAEPVAESHSGGTSGIRRISNQEPENFAAEERHYASTIDRLSAVRQREKTAQAEVIEAEIEARVAQELEITLAERRLSLARAQLRLAQQQLNSAVEAAGGEIKSADPWEPVQAIESLDEAEPRRSPDSRSPLPAPRRLKVDRTSAVEPEGNDFLAGITEEPKTESKELATDAGWLEESASVDLNSLSESRSIDEEHAGANVPAAAAGAHVTQMASEVAENEAEPNILLTSHAEETEPAEFDAGISDDLMEATPLDGTENASVRAKHDLKRMQHLPDARANQKEQPIRSLDEQTLRRRDVVTRTAYTKKSPAVPPTLMYR